MCRWLAYYGDPIPIEALILRRQHSLIDQSLHSREGAETTNGDGFGVGWYNELGGMPGLYKSIQPAWNDRNLRELAKHISSPLFFAHIRASSGTAVQETNAHPFRYGRWLFMHNGLVREYPRVRRDLMLAIDPALFPDIEGSSDSEVLFHLALTFGSQDDPLTALELMVGFVEEVGERHGVEYPIHDDRLRRATASGSSPPAIRVKGNRAPSTSARMCMLSRRNIRTSRSFRGSRTSHARSSRNHWEMSSEHGTKCPSRP